MRAPWILLLVFVLAFGGFSFPGDATAPTVAYLSYFGGSSHEYAYDVASAPDRTTYFVGSTSSYNFPDADFDGSYPAPFIVGMSPDGEVTLVEEFGGEFDDVPLAVTTDTSGNAIMVGVAWSSDFPVVNAYQASLAGSGDAFVLKIDPLGNIAFSTYLGGSDWDGAVDVVTDELGYIYVAGTTHSGDFPSNDAFSVGSYDNMFFAKFSPNGELVFSTVIGGTDGPYGGGNHASSIAVDSDHRLYFAGASSAVDFPTQNPLNDRFDTTGHGDVIIGVLDADGDSLLFATYWGGADGEDAGAIALDAEGRIFVAGYTTSPDFPTTRRVLPHPGAGGLFLLRIDAGWTLGFATRFGGTRGDSVWDMTISDVGEVVLVGWTDSPDFPLLNSVKASLTGPRDGFLLAVSLDGDQLLLSTLLGGSGDDYVLGLAEESAGSFVVAGGTYSSDLPVVNAIQAERPGEIDVMVGRLEVPPMPRPTAHIEPVAPIECEAGRGEGVLDGTRSTGAGNLSFEWSASEAELDDRFVPITTASGVVGSHEIVLMVSDEAAMDVAVTDLIVVDTAVPVTTLRVDGLGGDEDWWRSAVTVDVNATDACLLLSSSAILDGEAVRAFPFLISSEGVHQVSYGSTDAAGNVEPRQQRDVGLDFTPPQTSFGLDGLEGKRGWWRSSVALDVICDDTLSGCASTSAMLDGSVPLTLEDVVTVADDGYHAAEGASADVAGNVGDIVTAAFKIDTTEPTLDVVEPEVGSVHVAGQSIDADISVLGLSVEGSVGVAIGDVQFVAKAEDALSGVHSVSLVVDDSVQEVAFAPSHGYYYLTWHARAGTTRIHSVRVVAEDGAGNTESAAFQFLTLHY